LFVLEEEEEEEGNKKRHCIKDVIKIKCFYVSKHK
jgi:hypothetical protein